jgi:hypothetical protein
MAVIKIHELFSCLQIKSMNYIPFFKYNACLFEPINKNSDIWNFISLAYKWMIYQIYVLHVDLYCRMTIFNIRDNFMGGKQIVNFFLYVLLVIIFVSILPNMVLT